MILKSIRLNNIRSFRDERIEFPEGSVLLSGNVGSGKSTILLAIDFALFGTRRGELAGSDLLRHGEDYGYVELDFDVDGKKVEIKRVLKRGKGIVQDSGFIIINGYRLEYTPMELKAKVLELFGYPKDLLKKNKPIFRYTVYTPQEQMKHILLFPEERLETIRKIFDVEKYGRIRDNTKLFTTELRAMKRVLDAFVRDLDQKIIEMNNKMEERIEIDDRLDVQISKINRIDERLQEKKTEMELIKREIEEMNKIKHESAKKEVELRLKKGMLERTINDLNEIENKLASGREQFKQYAELKEPEMSEKEIKNSISALDVERDALLSKKAVIADELAKLEKIYEKGICDVCEQRVHDTASFRFNIDKKAVMRKELDEKIFEIGSGIKKLKDDYSRLISVVANLENKKHLEKALAELLSDKEKLADDKSLLNAEMNSIHRYLDFIKPELEAYRGIEERSAVIEKGFYAVQNEKIAAEKEKSRIEQQLADTEKALDTLSKDIEEKKKDAEKIRKIGELINWFDSYFINLMMVIEKKVMMAIQKEFNSLFQNWFSMIMGDDMEVRIDEQFSPVIEQNGYETDYQNLSGGEKTSVALAYRLALNKVINSLIETIKTKDLLILDEPTDGFSAEQLDRIRDVINELDLKQIIIVSHEPKIDTFVDNVIKLSKENHVSSVVS
ncbi:MAG: AAA family ATPase [Candidatus Aenigmarchaeota archaeon]|nr:AAA family ATPase [Candidatus Aenigmarchaeota archaeon]